MSNQLSRPSLNENVCWSHPSLRAVCLSLMNMYVAAELLCRPLLPMYLLEVNQLLAAVIVI